MGASLEDRLRRADVYRLPTDAWPTRYALRFELDLETWRFEGHERCDFVLERSRRELVLHALDLQIEGPMLVSREGTLVPDLAFDPDAGTVTLVLSDELRPGRWCLDVRLKGLIRDDLKALYRSIRRDSHFALTSLWPAESRRLYVSFDEPSFKAPFALELVTGPNLTAIANSRVIERRDLDDQRILWRFAETPPLSPYLLAFAVGPFEGTDIVMTDSGHPVRIWVPQGLSRDGAYARDAQRASIDWIEQYTGIAYPYEKLDGVGVADFASGAMENPGAITYRLEFVTASPGKASTHALKAAVRVVAHEVTHMWWGNLVTLAWWDDLWLSESFATFVGCKVVDALHPAWREWRDFVIGSTRGMAMDALRSTHAVHAHVESARLALQRLDVITYQKGAAVLRMLEIHVGEAVFQEAVRSFLKRFYGSVATASHFWRALDEASEQNVSGIARAWIIEPGHPLIELHVEDDRLELRQRRFMLDQKEPVTKQRWPIPLLLRTPAGETRVLLDTEHASIERPSGADAWLHPNARAAGFYRFLLDGGMRERLLIHVGEMSPEERIVLLDNEWALLQAGITDARAYVSTLKAFVGEGDRSVLDVALNQLQWLWAHSLGPGDGHRLAGLAGELFGPHLERLGLDVRRGEDEDSRELRTLAIRAMGTLASSAVVRREAASRVREHLDGRVQNRDLVPVLAAVAAIEGDVTLHSRYIACIRGGDPQDVAQFRDALPQFRDEAATLSTLAQIEDRTIRDQDLAGIFTIALGEPVQRAAYWGAFKARFIQRILGLEEKSRNRALRSLSQLTPPELASEADALLANLMGAGCDDVVTSTREGLRLQSAAAQRIKRQFVAASLPVG